MDLMEVQIAATPVRDVIPKDRPLRERIEFAMRYVRSHERDLFWMSHQVNDDLMFRTALAAVMLSGDESDRDIITRSMKPLRMFSAAVSGIPVDFSAFDFTDDLLPLMGIFNDSKKTPGELEADSWASNENSSPQVTPNTNESPR